MAASCRCRGNTAHEAAQREHGIGNIDLLVVNLYPFEQTVDRDADWDTTIENIDVGGPAMIRAAAKNHESVTVVVDPSDYAAVLAEMTRAARVHHAGAAPPSCCQGLRADGVL